MKAFEAVADDGRVMPSHSVRAGLMIGTTEHLAILQKVLMSWLLVLQAIVLVQHDSPEDLVLV